MIHKPLPVAAQTAASLGKGRLFGGAVYKLYGKSKKAAFLSDITYAGSHIILAGPS